MLIPGGKQTFKSLSRTTLFMFKMHNFVRLVRTEQFCADHVIDIRQLYNI